MATSIITTCPKCNKQFNVLAELAGKKIRCKECGNVFPVKGKNGDSDRAIKEKKSGSAPPAAIKKNPTEGTDDDATPLGLTMIDLAPRCPVCANELESADAVICLHCGFNTRTRTALKTKKTVHITSKDRFMWQLPAYLCLFAIFFMIGFWFFYHFALPYVIFGQQWDEVMDRADVHGSRRKAAGHEKLSDGSVLSYLFAPQCEWWVDLSLIGASVFCGRFAYKRLIVNRSPPETVLN